MVFRIEHRIGVAAPASQVWELVSQLDGWKDWTEVYTHASGTLRIGEKLSFTFVVGDRPPQSIEGTVVDWVPEAQMVWHVKFIGHYLKSLRYVEIEKLSETSCILANGDIYSGPLTFLIPRSLRSLVRDGFERMNENAKRIAEAAWKAKGGEVAPAPAAVSEHDFTIQPLMKPTNTGLAKAWGMGKRAAGGLGPRLGS